MALFYASTLALPLPFISIGNLLFLALAIIVFGFWRASPARPWPVTEIEYLIHLLVDVVLLCFLLYLTGGASNPLVSLLLIPLTISAALLPARYTCVITAFSLVSYTTLLYYFIPLEIISTHHAPTGISPHIAGMWFTFLLSALLITYFITRMAQALRLQEQHLQRNRENTLRDEQVLAVATLAASAAHDLGTPLSTMRVLLAEMESETMGDKAMNDDVRLLEAQVERCKTSLNHLVHSVGDQAANENVAVPAEEFLSQLYDRWRSLCPEVKIESHMADNVRGACLNNTPSLTQALMNVLNNVAQISDTVEIDVSRKGDTLHIALRDFGPGVPVEMLEQIGLSPLGQSKNGLGLGLFLTHATIERMGGSIQLENHPQGGSITQICVPVCSVVSR